MAAWRLKNKNKRLKDASVKIMLGLEMKDKKALWQRDICGKAVARLIIEFEIVMVSCGIEGLIGVIVFCRTACHLMFCRTKTVRR